MHLSEVLYSKQLAQRETRSKYDNISYYTTVQI